MIKNSTEQLIRIERKLFKILFPMVLLLMVGLMFSSCGASAIDASGDVGIRGLITQVSPGEAGSDFVGVVLVEGTQAENTGLISDKASVTLTKETVFIKGETKKLIEASDLSALTVGTKVEVVFTGPVAESYPVQGGAKVVRVIQ
jgi:beta-N-acetylhexosaminidase